MAVSCPCPCREPKGRETKRVRVRWGFGYLGSDLSAKTRTISCSRQHFNRSRWERLYGTLGEKNFNGEGKWCGEEYHLLRKFGRVHFLRRRVYEQRGFHRPRDVYTIKSYFAYEERSLNSPPGPRVCIHGVLSNHYCVPYA